MTVRVPAKVNLQLSVGRPRPDGYHELLSVFMAVGLCDEVYATDGRGVSSTAEGEGSGALPGDDRNLAVRAARLLAARTGTVRGARLHLTKNIPVAGGMAGGSADAAAALLACNSLWDTRLGKADLLAPSVLPPHLLGGGIRPDAALLRALRDNDVASLAAALGASLDDGRSDVNDLEAAALSLRPALADTLRTGRRAGACAAFVSGSGPTCVFLAKDARVAEHIKAQLEKSGTCRTAAITVGPVPGATVQNGKGRL
ncbi:4-(cytidine 5'-diphospho)-2-C-methyl-D-erythritol kinase [Streptomyces sp. NPDC019937]|uniref:GHMP family kinase ATP-binding protein n=1 Tax=Streptomyces sp. NPDC019937 TaxID=3154787 RepID=UPI0033EB908F